MKKTKSLLIWILRFLAAFLFGTIGIFPSNGQDNLPPINIELIAPPLIYPEKIGNASYSRHCLVSDDFLDLTPDRFSMILNDAVVSKIRLTDGAPSEKQADDPREKHTLFIDHRGRLLQLWIPTEDYTGKLSLRTAVDGRLSPVYHITVSRMGRWTTVFFAAMIATYICVMALSLLSMIKLNIGGSSRSLLKRLLLDEETASYSLSKFQFTVWTIVVLFASVFVLFSKNLSQGRVLTADLPGNILWMLGISAGTIVLSLAIRSVKGPKGGPPMRPSLADFVTTGGVMALERVLLFFWTIIAGSAVMGILLSSDPGTIQDSPIVPFSLVCVMAISSLAYLGGKLVRNPAPIMNEIIAITAEIPPKLVLIIRGRKLSKTGAFRIDELAVKTAEHRQQVEAGFADTDDLRRPPDFYKILKLRIRQPNDQWLTSQVHSLTLINPDGQKVQSPFAFRPYDYSSSTRQNAYQAKEPALRRPRCSARRVGPRRLGFR